MSVYHMDTFPAEIKSDQSKTIFKNFLKEFYEGNYNYKYREQLKDHFNLGEYWITVNLEDLDSYDEIVSDRLKKNPAMMMEFFEQAATEVCDEVTRPRKEGFEVVPRIQVMITSCVLPTSLRDLRSDMVSKLVSVQGIVVTASQTRIKAYNLTLQCSGCRDFVPNFHVKRGLDGFNFPRKCPNRDDGTGNRLNRCPLDPYVVVPDKCKCIDIQTLKLQELPENTPQGAMPRHLKLYCDRYLCDKLVPGNRVTLFGTLAIIKTNNQNMSSKAAESNFRIGLRATYLQVIGYQIQTTGPGHSSSIPYTAEEEEEFRLLASRPDCYQRICASIAPYIHGFEDVKKAVATLLFSGSVKIYSDGTKRRGDINVLLLGDPGTAKSQILKFVELVAPIGVYTSGKGSSAAGLTASVIRDVSSRSFAIEGGAMVLADGGVVCIDEFDKMRESDRVAIHEAMEQQTISIAKAGITVTLNSRCAVLAAANSVHGRWDDLRSDEENIDFMPTILSRFDMIFVIKDKHNYASDMEKARHVLSIHSGTDRHSMRANGFGGSAGRGDEDNEELSLEFLKKYIAYCKSKVGPRTSEAAGSMLSAKYVEMRNGPAPESESNLSNGTNGLTNGKTSKSQDKANKDKEERQRYEKKSIIPITVRQLEATIRISEALAKMELKQFATEKHIQESLRLFKESSLKASQAGELTGAEGFITDKDREIMNIIEKRIRRGLSHGALLNEEAIVQDFMNQKFDQKLIKLVLRLLVRTEVLTRRGAPKGKLLCILK